VNPGSNERIAHFPARRERWIVTPVVAGALILAILVPALLRRGEAPQDMAFRGGGIHPLSPSGPSERDVEFRWSSATSAARFQVIAGRDERVIFAAQTDRRRLALPDATRDRLVAGATYWWTVSALDRKGDVVSVSARRTFTVR
jgi:hypothetical protein